MEIESIVYADDSTTQRKDSIVHVNDSTTYRKDSLIQEKDSSFNGAIQPHTAFIHRSLSMLTLNALAGFI